MSYNNISIDFGAWNDCSSSIVCEFLSGVPEQKIGDLLQIKTHFSLHRNLLERHDLLLTH